MAKPSRLSGDLYINQRQDGEGGNLFVQGDIHAANYPPKYDPSEGVYQDYWDVLEPTQKDFVIDHPFNAKFVRCNVYDTEIDREVITDVRYDRIGRLTVRFAEAPGVGKRFKIVITYHGETDEEEEE